MIKHTFLSLTSSLYDLDFACKTNSILVKLYSIDLGTLLVRERLRWVACDSTSGTIPDSSNQNFEECLDPLSWANLIVLRPAIFQDCLFHMVR